MLLNVPNVLVTVLIVPLLLHVTNVWLVTISLKIKKNVKNAPKKDVLIVTLNVLEVVLNVSILKK